MDEEPERAKRWEGGYERTWEILKEDESGSLKATVENILFKAKRKRVFEPHGQVRLGMMRHLYVVVDTSRTMEDQDLKPNRLTSTLKLLEYFVEEYFDQNPISQMGIITTKNKRAEKLTDLAGNPKKHIADLKKAKDTTCVGEPSLYNSLSLAMQTLRHMPGHASREVLVIFSSLTTCDPANIYELIKSLKALKIRVSVIGLSAEVRVCTVLTRETGGTYHVILDESHYKELLQYHVKPHPASSSSECSLIRMGTFPVSLPCAPSFEWVHFLSPCLVLPHSNGYISCLLALCSLIRMGTFPVSLPCAPSFEWVFLSIQLHPRVIRIPNRLSAWREYRKAVLLFGIGHSILLFINVFIFINCFNSIAQKQQQSRR
ncbi:general transcription factor IIH subunit 2-like isoform X2 [Acipenser ruthenus]|uniref:general transcription factor IIH subunit 2-like isoform X2 n=1 Tax=Acipenser ruthenus TaxID=7906 RepID=UPI002740FD26|nr:general transcription factor IIH subunit 2-like isoform X2 [Acipenser ruthenus]